MFVESLTLCMTNNCNLACAYCFEGLKHKQAMSWEVARQSVDWFMSKPVSGPVKNLDMTFFGGEPLLEMKTIEKIVAYARHRAHDLGKQISFSITTNGVLFDEKVARFWREHDMGVLLSCDGNRQAHDMFRKYRSGRGSFDAVVKNMPHILSVKRSGEVRMTVLPATTEYMEEGVRFLQEKGFDKVAVFHAEEPTWTEQDLLRYEQSWFALGDLLVTSLEQGEDLSVSPLVKVIENKMKKSSSDNLESSACGAGRGYLAVGTDGTIFPCHRFASANNFSGAFPLGSIFDGIDHQKRLPWLRMRKKQWLGCDMECGRCALQESCSGGCFAANYEVTGHLTLRPSSSRLH